MATAFSHAPAPIAMTTTRNAPLVENPADYDILTGTLRQAAIADTKAWAREFAAAAEDYGVTLEVDIAFNNVPTRGRPWPGVSVYYYHDPTDIYGEPEWPQAPPIAAFFPTNRVWKVAHRAPRLIGPHTPLPPVATQLIASPHLDTLDLFTKTHNDVDTSLRAVTSPHIRLIHIHGYGRPMDIGGVATALANTELPRDTDVLFDGRVAPTTRFTLSEHQCDTLAALDIGINLGNDNDAPSVFPALATVPIRTLCVFITYAAVATAFKDPTHFQHLRTLRFLYNDQSFTVPPFLCGYPIGVSSLFDVVPDLARLPRLARADFNFELGDSMPITARNFWQHFFRHLYTPAPDGSRPFPALRYTTRPHSNDRSSFLYVTDPRLRTLPVYTDLRRALNDRHHTLLLPVRLGEDDTLYIRGRQGPWQSGVLQIATLLAAHRAMPKSRHFADDPVTYLIVCLCGVATYNHVRRTFATRTATSPRGRVKDSDEAKDTDSQDGGQVDAPFGPASAPPTDTPRPAKRRRLRMHNNPAVATVPRRRTSAVCPRACKCAPHLVRRVVSYL